MNLDERLKELEGFLQFVIAEWPGLRGQFVDQLAPRCSKCILSAKCSPLEDGLCEVCRQSQEPSPGKLPGDPQAQTRLDSLLVEYAGQGKGAYGAVVMFSGGKDSAYLLHRLRTDFTGLRLVALTVDNSFMSPVALANCRHVLGRLEDVDHVILRPKNSLYRRAFRHAFTHLNPGGCYTTVDRMDGDLTFDIGRNFAASHRIPLMISGLSPEQVTRILDFDDFESPADKENMARTESAGFPLNTLYSAEELRQYWWDPSRWPRESLPRVLHPFHAWRYDEEAIAREVIQLGLIPPGSNNPLVTNNDTIPVMLAVDSIRMGYSGFEPEFAQLVRQGKADRAVWLSMFEALEYLVPRGQFVPNCISDTLQRLGLTHADVGLPEPAQSQEQILQP